MVRGEVERAEVVPGVLGLGTEGDGEAKFTEDLDDLVDDEGDRMDRAVPAAASGHREVECRATGRGRRSELGATRFERFLECDLHRIRALSSIAAILLG